MTTLTLHATGPVDPAEVWERYAVPGRWSEWSPQITGVEGPVERLAAGAAVPFRVEDVDEVARRWLWQVHVGPVRLRLLHWVQSAPDGGTTTGLRITGPLPIVLGYAPAALLALRRLVRPL